MMKRLTVLAAVAVAVAGFAKTTTWTAGSTGKLSQASNWDNGAPESGDTAKFTKEVTLDAESFDLGADGLTVENSAKVTWPVRLTGQGEFVKAGSGQLVVKTNAFHTGGTRLTRGKFSVNNRYSKPQCFGSGDITIVRYDDSSPTLDFAEWTCGLTNSIVVHGSITTGGGNGEGGAVYVHNPATVGGSITCDDDTYLNISWGGITVNGPVTCPSDKTLKINCNCGNNGGTIFHVNLKKAVDASIVKIGNRNLNIDGVCTNKANSLTINAGTNLFGTAASWAGTNIVVSGSTAVLRAQRATNIASPETVLKLTNGGKVVLDANVFVRVGEFWVNGVKQPDGIYDTYDYPNGISGGGYLVVGSVAGTCNFWKGPASGSWNQTANWSQGVLPGGASMAVFTNVVTTFKEDVAIPDGLTILNPTTLNCSNSFTGAGCLTKLGAGIMDIRRADSSHTGGTRLLNGQLYFNNRYTKFTFGTGPITLVRHTASSPSIAMREWDSGLKNDIVIQGAITNGNGAVWSSNPPTFSGSVTGDSDVKIAGFWGGLTFNGPISFPGHTVSFVCACEDNKGNPFAITCNGAFNGSIVKTGNRYLYLNGRSTNPDDVLTINESTNQLGTAAYWAGTNIVVSGSSSVLRLTSTGNLSTDAAVRLSQGGKVYVQNGVRACVSALFFDGEPQPSGIYRAAAYPAYVAGEGKIVVGTPSTILIIR